jgi:hypothetical protein
MGIPVTFGKPIIAIVESFSDHLLGLKLHMLAWAARERVCVFCYHVLS